MKHTLTHTKADLWASDFNDILLFHPHPFRRYFQHHFLLLRQKKRHIEVQHRNYFGLHLSFFVHFLVKYLKDAVQFFFQPSRQKSCLFYARGKERKINICSSGGGRVREVSVLSLKAQRITRTLILPQTSCAVCGATDEKKTTLISLF